uniref:RING-type E3 ubiquitin transferase n=1 Tax=Takifugu rubripes TaxID=31033 RepID=A0A674P8S9_TAKRU
MAEASLRSGRFFCHRCSKEISPRLPDYTCPVCESGFIEELSEERRSENGSASTSSTRHHNHSLSENADHQHFFTFPSGYGPFTLGIFDESFDLRTQLPAEDNRETENRREREMASRQRYGARQPRGRHVSRRQSARHEGVPTLEGIIQQLVNGIIQMALMQLLHRYQRRLKSCINEFENTGPPPADKERIKSLPIISITEEHVGAGLECPVCKEDYSVEESVRQLPCNHLFHNDCIVPWLEQHDTCPVCRKSLSGQNTATDSPELAGMNYSPTSSSSSSSSSPSNENAASNA